MKKLIKELQKLKRKHYSKFFYVKFVKRTNGELRKMGCKLGVRGKNNGELSYNPEDYNLMCVYDIEKCEHRMINLDDVRYLAYEHKKLKT